MYTWCFFYSSRVNSSYHTWNSCGALISTDIIGSRTMGRAFSSAEKKQSVSEQTKRCHFPHFTSARLPNVLLWINMHRWKPRISAFLEDATKKISKNGLLDLTWSIKIIFISNYSWLTGQRMHRTYKQVSHSFQENFRSLMKGVYCVEDDRPANQNRHVWCEWWH